LPTRSFSAAVAEAVAKASASAMIDSRETVRFMAISS
jgi:hypothetical protein